MSDTPVAAPSTPAASSAPATPSTPTAGAPTHHAALQARTPTGQFAGPPDTSKTPSAAQATPPPAPEAPKTWKVGGREFKSVDELAAYTAEADAEARAAAEHRKQAAEYAAKVREYEERLKDPRKVITPELRRQMIQEEIQQFQESERVKAMTPEQRELYLYAREQERKAKELEAKVKAAEEAEVAAKKKAEDEAAAKQRAEEQEEMKALMQTAMEKAGLPMTVFNVQHMALVMAGAAQRGVVYPPEVIAAKTLARVRAAEAEAGSKANPVQYVRERPWLIQHLNALDDASLLRELAPLGEKLRRLNLEALGAAPAAAPQPVVTGAMPSTAEKPPPGHPEWERIFRERAKGR